MRSPIGGQAALAMLDAVVISRQHWTPEQWQEFEKQKAESVGFTPGVCAGGCGVITAQQYCRKCKKARK